VSCKEPTDCDTTVAKSCKSLDKGVSPSTVTAATDCLESGVCGVANCLARAQKSAKPGAAHKKLAEDYCTFCAPNVEDCQTLFYAKKGGLPGSLVLPYADDIVTQVDDACTSDRDKCRAQFASCATETISRAVADALEADLAECVVSAFQGAGDTGTGPGGGPQVTTCTPQNCDGCCRDDKCEKGDTEATCGASASACEVCRGAQKCTAGKCKEPCGPNNCKGCCDGDTCQPGTATDKCGNEGLACNTCTKQGASFICSNHTCIDGSCQATCTTGCCTAAGCQPGTAAKACGTGGEGCIDCGFGRTCGATTATCAIDPNATWDFYVSFAVVPDKVKSTGASWDPTNGAPDPQLYAYSSEGSSFHSGHTTVQKDSTFPFWAETPLTGIKASELMKDLSFDLWDSDEDISGDFDDYMGGCTLPLKAEVFDGSLQSYDCPETTTTGKITLYYRIKPHP